MQATISEPRTLPKFADWQTYGGGFSSNGRYSYHAPVTGGPVSAHGSPGTYMVDPVTWDNGRHRGYRVLFCDAGGELIARGVQRGLYSDLTGGRTVTLPEAKHIVRNHFNAHFSPESRS